MAKTKNISVRVSEEVNEKLDALARNTNRSKAYLAAEAIGAYVETNAWQVEAIGKAVAKADAGGPFVAHQDAERYLESLARGRRPKRPKTVAR